MTDRIGFIGLGAMGKPMAINLVEKGFSLAVYDLRPEPVEELAGLGAQKAGSAREVAEKSNVVITMLVSSPHVESAVLGTNGVLEGIGSGAVLIDMSSIAPEVTRRVGERIREKGAEMLDAPVARGVKAAVAGTLAVFVGGNRDTFKKYSYILEAMGTDIDYVGELGCGTTVKVVNQLILSATVAATAEGLVLGTKGGVDPDILVEVLEKGSANSFALQNHFKKFALKGNFGESIFPVPYIQKDISLAVQTGKDLNVPLFMTSTADQMYEMARATGRDKNYFPVVIRVLEDFAGVKCRSGEK